LPNQLVARRRVMLPAQISSYFSYKTYGIIQLSGLLKVFFLRRLRGPSVRCRRRAPRQGGLESRVPQSHQHGPPGNYEVDGDGPLEAVRGLVRQIFNLTPALQYPVPVLDPPAQALPPQASLCLLGRSDFHRGQEPLDQFDSLGMVFLNRMDDREGYRFLISVVGRWTQLDPLVAKRHLRGPLRPFGTGLLHAPFRPGALSVNVKVELKPRLSGFDSVKKLQVFCGAPVIHGPHGPLRTRSECAACRYRRLCSRVRPGSSSSSPVTVK